PGKLHDFVFENGDSFSKELWRQFYFANNLPSLETNLSKRGTALDAGFLIEIAFMISKSLGESGRVVRKLSNNFERIFRRVFREMLVDRRWGGGLAKCSSARNCQS